MATLTTPLPTIAYARPRGRPPVTGPIVVTSYGDAASDGAVRLAVSAAQRAECAVHLVTVLEPAPLVVPELGAIMDIPDDEAGRRAMVTRALAAQLARLHLPPGAVVIDVHVGDPARVIVRVAHDLGARLLMLGASHHDLLDRVFGADTAVRVARGADIPVLVVPRDYGELPRRAILAIDFSNDSVRAGRAALELFPDLQDVHLAHVGPPVEPALDLLIERQGTYDESVERAFDRVREALPVSAGATVRRHVLRGNPAREITRLASERGADLVVAGSHGRGAFQRIFAGSVATALVRSSTVPVLILPIRASVRVREASATVDALRDPTSWPQALDEFSVRNAGRRATLEIDDPELGAQAQEVDYPFGGCLYDPFDGRLAIILGDGQSRAPHLVRGVSHVSEVDILRGEDGRDRVLRVVHGRRGGQTLLIFTA